jgi:maltose/maltodextrin transport system substrate-binding protein
MKHSKILFMIIIMALVFSNVAMAQDDVTLTLWHAKTDAEGDMLISLVDAFNAENPGITVELVYNPSDTLQDSFVTAAGSGEGPDMVIWANDSTGPWASAGLLMGIGDYIDDDLRAQVAESGWGSATYSGEVYGITFSAKTLAFFYNIALVPDAPGTWDEVLEISEELAEEGLVGLAFQNGFFHSAGFLYALGGSLMDEDGNANFVPGTDGAEGMDAYLQFHQDMYLLAQDPDSGVVIDGSSPNPGFQQGDVAMVYDGIWNLSQFEADLGDDLGVAVMPTVGGEVPALFAQTEVFFASASMDEAEVEAFIAWGRFVTSVEGQTIASVEGGLMPVNPAVKLESANLQTFATQFTYGTPFPNRQELGAFWGPMADSIAAVSEGGEAPADARAAAYDLIQENIDGMHADE